MSFRFLIDLVPPFSPFNFYTLSILFGLATLSFEKFIWQQVKCFNKPLQPSEVAKIKTIVQQKVPEGVNSNGLTFPGFIFVHDMFLKRGRIEAFWAVLRKFGYDNDLKLQDDFLPVPSKQASDQVDLFFWFWL